MKQHKKSAGLRLAATIIILSMIMSVFTGCSEEPSAPVNAPTADLTPAADPVGTQTPAPTEVPAASPLSASGEFIVSDVDTSYLTTVTEEDNARVFYHIFVGSFSDSNGDGIGDLRGIINRMDYLNDGDPASGTSLGVQGIWLSPVFKSPSYHKYDVTDYYQIDPQFGTMEDLTELVALCHERGVKLILDLVINHTGSSNLWFTKFCNARKDKDTESDYYDFYTVGDSVRDGSRTFSKVSGADCYYECNFSGSMPEPNFDNPFVYDTFLEVARYYLEDIGVDGFRFDAAKYIYYGDEDKNVLFWLKYMQDLKAKKPDIYAVAEVWSADNDIIRYSPALNCFDFSMAQVDGMISSTAKHGSVGGYTSYIENYLNSLSQKVGDAISADYQIQVASGNTDPVNRPENYNSSPMLVSFIANHDTDRAAGYMTYSSGYAKMAASLLLLTPGSPFIYYGEEIGMKGSRGSANTDSNRRLAMLWGDGDTVRDPEGTTFDSSKQTNGTVADMKGSEGSLLTHYKRLIMIRQSNPEIASGEFKALKLEATKAGGFVSLGNGSHVLVLHNTTGSPAIIDLAEAMLTDGTLLSDLIDLGTCRITDTVYSSMEYEKTESSLSGTILTLAEQSSVIIR